MALSERNSRFELSKWYLDCVSDEGDVFLGYSAELRWRALTLHYASALNLYGSSLRERSSLRKSPAPTPGDGLIEWQCPPLKLHGEWRAIDPPLRASIYRSEPGVVEWCCFQPRACAEVGVGNNRSICGLGYAEHLTLSIPPWRLPLRELHWGRFLGKTDAVVWIDWRGEHSVRLVFHNGSPARASRITDAEIALDGSTLVLESKRTLREGPIGVLARVPNLSRLFPARILNARECKWRSRGVLRRPGAPDSGGWAIHEVVAWP